MNKRQSNMKQKGFTLIEVMIVVAIIGIVAAIGYPSYLSQIEKTRRSDAHVSLLNTAQHMERCKTTAFTYANCTIPTTYLESPEGYYDLTFENAPTARTFTVTATAKGAQAGDTTCQTITLNEISGKLPAECW